MDASCVDRPLLALTRAVKAAEVAAGFGAFLSSVARDLVWRVRVCA